MLQIVLSGSMRFLEDMKDCALCAQSRGIAAFVPEEAPQQSMVFSDFIAFKQQVTKRHYDIIASEETKALLVVNKPKNGVENYIGASTVAEMAIAYYFKKRIFLLNGMYPPYIDELLSWQAVALQGDLDSMFATLQKTLVRPVATPTVELLHCD